MTREAWPDQDTHAAWRLRVPVRTGWAELAPSLHAAPAPLPVVAEDDRGCEVTLGALVPPAVPRWLDVLVVALACANVALLPVLVLLG